MRTVSAAATTDQVAGRASDRADPRRDITGLIDVTVTTDNDKLTVTWQRTTTRSTRPRRSTGSTRRDEPPRPDHRRAVLRLYKDQQIVERRHRDMNRPSSPADLSAQRRPHPRADQHRRNLPPDLRADRSPNPRRARRGPTATRPAPRGRAARPTGRNIIAAFQDLADLHPHRHPTRPAHRHPTTHPRPTEIQGGKENVKGRASAWWHCRMNASSSVASDRERVDMGSLIVRYAATVMRSNLSAISLPNAPPRSRAILSMPCEVWVRLQSRCSSSESERRSNESERPSWVGINGRSPSMTTPSCRAHEKGPPPRWRVEPRPVAAGRTVVRRLEHPVHEQRGLAAGSRPTFRRYESGPWGSERDARRSYRGRADYR